MINSPSPYAGLIADNSVTGAKLGTGTLKFIAEGVVAGAAVTTISFTGLNLDTDKMYFIVLNIKNAGAGNRVLSMYMNADTTATNYYVQWLDANGAGVASGRANDARIMDVIASTDSVGFIFMTKLASRIPRSICDAMVDVPASCQQLKYAHIRKTDTSNVTQIDFTISSASQIDIGSRISIYRVT
jgi:hypothetical protein